MSVNLSIRLKAGIVAISMSISGILGIGSAAALPMSWSLGSGGNGHYYEVIISNGPISWNSANNAANASSFNGVLGHLATITSLGESNFIKALPGFGSSFVSVQRLVNAFLGPWIGGMRDGNRNWIWVDDPLNPFADNTNANGVGGGNALSGQFVDWVGVEPNDGGSTGGPDDFLVFLDWQASPGATGIGWADCTNVCLNTSRSNEKVIAYVVEYDIPEPGTLVLFGAGLLGLGVARRFKSVRKSV